ncbi:hypothetical protein C0431_14595 [bacterium]|nr:hypothetical protein [bacterium]
MEKVVYWFRRDLRVRDNWGLIRAASRGPVVGVFVWDSAVVGRAGRFGQAFLVDSLVQLREEMRRCGSDLVVVRDLEELEGRQVVCSDEVGVFESAEADRVGAELVRQDFLVDYDWRKLPGIFTKFRKEVEPLGAVQVLGVPELRGWVWDGEECLLDQLAEEVSIVELMMPPGLRGAAWRGTWFFSGLEPVPVSVYKDTRNGFDGWNSSSLLSSYLAWGCMSVREAAAEVRRCEDLYAANDSTYWFILELLWRDYFHYLARQQGVKMFLREGIQGLELDWSGGDELYDAWCGGWTGYPIVDACMRQLAATGWMSNRGRQITANFLTKVLNVDWRMGAEWFERNLIDYDVASNWGNWQYHAGVGTDGREFRVFHPVKQAAEHDPASEFIQKWLPELAGVSAKEARIPGAHCDVVVDFDEAVGVNRSQYLARARNSKAGS